MTSVFVFGIDGTLTDTPAATVELIGAVARDLGARPTRTEVSAVLGKPPQALFARLLGTCVHDTVTAEAVARYRRRFVTDVLGRGPALLLPGVAEGLDRLRAAGHPLGVATSKVYADAHALLDATGILNRFDTVVGHNMVGRGKPHPDLVVRVLADLGARASRSWYVGGTATDMTTARAAGLRAVGVSYGAYGADPVEALRAAGADHVVADFTSVTEVLLRGAASTARALGGNRPQPAGALP
ncbi:phosphoglycolate phosphatase [Streptomyces sp. V3I8]|jgi:phosphoglycolate phosphatase|uniref:HAD family hydrolase n=1 Tax=Streptomyces sp. V3I8 TaxID=3042279 RepID=UPI002789D5C2|nr:HAD family hydrolase [Streptomyces sp. V3I8]MDQ1033728.1 phosphoglycolate phosphatase [Streptomyces sp. V3I8]